MSKRIRRRHFYCYNNSSASMAAAIELLTLTLCTYSVREGGRRGRGQQFYEKEWKRLKGQGYDIALIPFKANTDSKPI
jgi:hypothetical protein